MQQAMLHMAVYSVVMLVKDNHSTCDEIGHGRCTQLTSDLLRRIYFTVQSSYGFKHRVQIQICSEAVDRRLRAHLDRFTSVPVLEANSVPAGTPNTVQFQFPENLEVNGAFGAHHGTCNYTLRNTSSPRPVHS